MFDIKDKLDDVFDSVEDVARDYYRLTVANSIDKGSKLGASLIINTVLLALVFFVFLFAGFGLSYWIGERLNSIMLGFFIVAGFLLLVLIIILSMKKKVIKPFIRDTIIRNFYD